MVAQANRGFDVKSMLFGALLLAAIVNVAQFWAINSRTPKNYRAFTRYSNPDLVHIGIREAPNFQRRHRSSLAFAAAITPGASIILPSARTDNEAELVQQLLSYGKASSVRRVDYDPELLAPKLNLKQHRMAHIRASSYQPRSFVLLARDKDVREFVLLRQGKADVLVETGLLPRRAKRKLAP